MSKTNTLPEHTINAMTAGPRWQILKALNEPKSAPTLAQELSLGPSNVTYHLKKLVAAGLVVEMYHPDSKHLRVFQRNSVFAEMLVDFTDGDKRLTQLSFTLDKAKRPRGYVEVKADD